jgi:DNA polymerase-3 subunit delta'
VAADHVDPAAGGASPVLRTRGHPAAVAAIRAMIAGRVPHAILFGGPPGIGKSTLALDLAAGLLCDQADPRTRPCRACRGCRLVDRGIHPDLHRLAPAGPGDQIRIGAREAPEDGTVRRLAIDLALLPVEGGARVAIIERADRMGDDAQTALLKTLEEPPAGVTMILCADDEDRLMPTVRSRCARVRLGPVGVREIEAILGDAGAADPPVAARLARLSAGRPGLASTLARAPDALAARDEIARTLLDLLAAGPAERLAATRGLLTRAGDVDRAVRAALDGGDDGLSTSPAARGRRGRRTVGATAPGPALGGSSPSASGAGSADGIADDSETAEDDLPVRGAVPAAERRRAAAVLVGVWREIARDLLVLRIGSDRDVRDPGLLDDLRAASASAGLGSESDAADANPLTRPLSEFLGRLDSAGELLESNVRAELIVDTLVLAWPAAARRAPVNRDATSRATR